MEISLVTFGASRYIMFHARNIRGMNILFPCMEITFLFMKMILSMHENDISIFLLFGVQNFRLYMHENVILMNAWNILMLRFFHA